LVAAHRQSRIIIRDTKHDKRVMYDEGTRKPPHPTVEVHADLYYPRVDNDRVVALLAGGDE
jgi:hypothetical protein